MLSYITSGAWSQEEGHILNVVVNESKPARMPFAGSYTFQKMTYVVVAGTCNYVIWGDGTCNLLQAADRHYWPPPAPHTHCLQFLLLLALASRCHCSCIFIMDFFKRGDRTHIYKWLRDLEMFSVFCFTLWSSSCLSNTEDELAPTLTCAFCT